MIVVGIILLGVALVLLLPVVAISLECFFASSRSVPSQEDISEIQSQRPSLAILVPAHNEAKYIRDTLEDLLPQVAEQDRILVIADNCVDDTATIARQTGVTVLERYNDQQRGKGYAIEYGLKHLEEDPPDIVVMVDGDCLVSELTISRIANLAATHSQPVQATYLMKPATEPSVKEKISAFALIVKNLVRPYGLASLHLPCTLQGSGMAFPWEAIKKVSFGNSKTVDDMQLTVDLSVVGYSPLYCSQGRIIGRLMQEDEAISQKYRWEHGHLSLILEKFPQLVKESVKQRRLDLLILALDISVPPLSLLILIELVATVGSLIIFLLGVSWLPLALFSVEIALLISAIGLAWTKFAREGLLLSTLLAIPFYLIWKLPIYVSWLLNPINNRSNWKLTERD